MTVEEVEQVLLEADEVLASASSNAPLVFGEISTGKSIAVVFEIIEESLLTVRVITAFEVNRSK